MADGKRLIDANELEDKFHETKMIEIFPYWKELSFDTQCELVRFGKALKKMMQNAPIVDAVEVVRCKGCKCFLEYTKEHAQSVDGADGDCYIRVMNSDDKQFCACKYDDFCSYGERKDNDND